ncbi:MAG: DUF1302 family protein [Pseudomonadota bacterium]
MRRLGIGLVALLTAAAATWAAETQAGPGLSTVLRTNYYSSSKSLDDASDFAGATFQLTALPKFTSTLDGKLFARATQPAIGKGGRARGRLVEGYLTLHLDHADLSVGKQIVAWGRADGINPTDNLTPRDYTVMLPFEDDQRLGTASAKLDVALSQEHTLTLFVAPRLEPSTVPLPREAYPVVRQRPSGSASNAQVGLRLNKVGEGADWSLSYFHGHSLLPSFGVPRADAATALHYDRISVLGADFAKNFGRFGVRGEASYTRTRDTSGTDPLVRNPQLFWVLGVDRTFFENLNLNVQVFQRRVIHFHRPDAAALPPQELRLALQNALLAGQQDRSNHGITFRVGNKWLHDTLEAELFAVVNAQRRNSLIRPLVTYTFSDHVKGTVGAEYFRGAPGTQYGSLRKNSGVFAELRLAF